MRVLASVSVFALCCSGFSSTAFVGAAQAESYVRCESSNYRYKECPLGDHGYVRLSREFSSSNCRQGRTWDYDRRHIWVDDGCRAEFVVEDRDGSHKDNSTNAAVAGLVVGALVAAAVASNHKDNHDDDGYGHGGNSSYVPSWMIGDFNGYNTNYGAPVDMSISSDGRATAHLNGRTVRGYVNDQRLYIGDAQFYIDRAGDGFNTRQINNSGNQVHYRRR